MRVFDDRADLRGGAGKVCDAAGVNESAPQRAEVGDRGGDLGDAGIDELAHRIAGAGAAAVDAEDLGDVVEVQTQG